MQDYRQRILSIINFNPSKTLNENYNSLIIEQKFGMNTDYTQLQSDQQKWEKEEEKSQYPNYCSSKDKAAKGYKNLIPNYCFYGAPVEMSYDGGVRGIWIHKDAKIKFWNLSSLNNFVDRVWTNWYENKKIEGYNKEDLIKNLSEVCPIGTVSQFSFSGRTYTSHIIFDRQEYQQDKKWIFKGFFSKEDKLKYEEPVWVETRTPKQIFIDNYGTYLQLGGVIATIIAGALTGGAGWVLWAEILYEGAIGHLVGQREFEKGENISAVFSYITGALPMLKLTKFFRGIDPKLFNELARDIASTTIRNEEEMLQFYNSLNDYPEKQKLFQKIFLQDEISEEIFEETIREMRTVDNLAIPPYVSTEQIMNLAKSVLENNSQMFKSLKFWDKLWARELTWNAIVGILDLVLDLTLGEKLNDKQKQSIEWAYAKIPDSHKKEFIYNVVNNPEVIQSFVEHIEDSRNLTIKKSDEYFSTILQHEIRKKGKDYVELPEDPSVSNVDLEKNSVNEKKLRDEGWIPQQEYKGESIIDLQFVGDTKWYKVGKMETKKDSINSNDK
jgi:hypothetical protein